MIERCLYPVKNKKETSLQGGGLVDLNYLRGLKPFLLLLNIAQMAGGEVQFPSKFL